MSRALVILPRDSTPATRQVLQALLVEKNNFSRISSIHVVRKLADVATSLEIPLHAFLSDWTLRSPLNSSQSELSGEALKSALVRISQQNFRYLVFLGGVRDASDALAVHEMSDELGFKLGIQFIPDDITNSVGGTDYCLGYGSFVGAFSSWLFGEDFDNASFFHGIKILVAPGRKSGWATLGGLVAKEQAGARSFSHVGPHVMSLPEQEFSTTQFVYNVLNAYLQHGRATVVVSEALLLKVMPEFESELGTAVATLRLSEYLMNMIRVQANSGNVFPVPRISSGCVLKDDSSFLRKISSADQRNAHILGRKAILNLLEQAPNGIIGLRRLTGLSEIVWDTVPVAFEIGIYREHCVPSSYLEAASNNSAYAEFLNYVRPLAETAASWKEDSKALDKSRAKMRLARAQSPLSMQELDLV